MKEKLPITPSPIPSTAIAAESAADDPLRNDVGDGEIEVAVPAGASAPSPVAASDGEAKMTARGVNVFYGD
jgi:hypothetical protein